MSVQRTTPRRHQAEALARSAGKRAFALLMSMRTGKTFVAIREWETEVLAGRADDLLVVAPAGSYRGWDLDKGPGQPGELTKHLDPALLARASIAAWVSGNAASRRACEALLEDPSGPRVLLVNVEALSSVEAARTLCERFLRQRRCAMVVDESTTIRTPDSSRTKKVLRLGQLAAYRRVMTGLATPRSPLDLWAQFNFLDPEILGPSFVTFRSRYAVVERICMLPTEALARMLEARAGESWSVPGVGVVCAADLSRQGLLEEMERRKIYVQTIPKIKGYRHEEELRDLVAPHSYRVTLDDVRDASPPVYVRREVELTAEQRRVYREVRENACARLASGDHVTATSVIGQMLRLHQVLCGHVRDEEGTEHEISERRTAVMLDALREYDGKAVVWVSYDPDVGRVVRALEGEHGEGCCARFWGGNRATREAEEERFKSDGECRFMVATPAAGGRGRTWSAADLAVYYSNTYDLEHRAQSEERTEAVEKTTGATRVDLVAPGTVDEVIIEALRRKIDLATAISGDDYREWLI